MSCRAAWAQSGGGTVSEHQSGLLSRTKMGIHHRRTRVIPSLESTHVVTSLGSDKLVVPEEKMADHEEQLSDEEKVISLISPRRKLRLGTLMLEVCCTHGCVFPWIPSAADVFKFEEYPGLGTATAAALIIFSSTSALCESLTKAPCTVLTQNRCRVPMINWHKLPTRTIFALWTCRSFLVPLVSCVMKFSYTKHQWLLI